jgi:hypothetical protein
MRQFLGPEFEILLSQEAANFFGDKWNLTE